MKKCQKFHSFCQSLNENRGRDWYCVFHISPMAGWCKFDLALFFFYYFDEVSFWRSWWEAVHRFFADSFYWPVVDAVCRKNLRVLQTRSCHFLIDLLMSCAHEDGIFLSNQSFPEPLSRSLRPEKKYCTLVRWCCHKNCTILELWKIIPIMRLNNITAVLLFTI